MEAYFSLWFVVMLLLNAVVKEDQAAHEFLGIYESNQSVPTDWTSNFLLYVDEPETMMETYLSDLAEDRDREEYCVPAEDCNGNLLSEFLPLLTQYASILSELRTSNSSELKVLYEVWFQVMAALSLACGREGIQGYDQACGALRDAVIAWTFAGGCQNFSITYYEQHHSLNHFSGTHTEADHSQGSRWLKYLHELREDQSVWKTMVRDIKIIRECRKYMLKHELLSDEQMRDMTAVLERKMSEIRDILEGIIEHLRQDRGEENLVKKLIYIRRQISIR